MKFNSLVVAEIVAALAGAGLFVVCAISYVRAVNALSSHLAIEKLDALRPTSFWPWRLLFLDFGTTSDRLWGYGRLSELILGLRVLGEPDERYKQLLWLARKRLIVCLFLFLAGVIWIGWLFQNARWGRAIACCTDECENANRAISLTLAHERIRSERQPNLSSSCRWAKNGSDLDDFLYRLFAEIPRVMLHKA